MQNRIQQLRDGLRESPLGKGTAYSTARDIHNKLFAAFNVINRENKSQFELDREINALIFLLAYISKNASQLEQPAQDPEFQRFKTFMYGANVLDNTDGGVHSRLNAFYQELIDWACYIQAKHGKALLADTSDPFMALLQKEDVISKELKLVYKTYTGYSAAQEDKRRAAFHWYIEEAETLRAKLAQEEALLWGVTIFCFTPTIFLLSGLPIAKEAWDKGEKWKAVGIGVGSFFLSLLPPLASIVNFFVYRSRVKQTEQALQAHNGSATSSMMVRLVLNEREYKHYQDRLDFRKSFKQGKFGEVKSIPVLPREQRQEPEALMNRTKKCVFVNKEAVAEGVPEEKTYEVFMTPKQYERHVDYREIRREYVKKQNHQGFDQDKVNRLFAKIQDSKKTREGAEVQNFVMMRYEHRPKPGK